MTRRAAFPWILCAVLGAIATGPAALGAAGSITAGKLPSAAESLPVGFKVVTDKHLGGSRMIEGVKANENVPKPRADLGITATCSWSPSPSAERVVQMLAQQTEDPGRPNPGSVTREEPAGRLKYRSGVLTWRRVITPWVGSGHGPDLVSWRGSWVAAHAGGLLGIGVDNFVGTRGGAQALIDEMIGKVVKTGCAEAGSATPGKGARTRTRKAR